MARRYSRAISLLSFGVLLACAAPESGGTDELPTTPGLSRMSNAADPRPTGRLAFQRSGEIWVMNVDGSNETRVTCNSRIDLGPAWSPDGQTLAFYSAVPGPNQDLYLLDVGTPWKCADGDLLTRGRFASWSYDGRIAFDRGSAGQRDVWVMGRDGSLADLTGDPDHPNDDPTREFRADWSPDGKKIVFTKGPARQENNEDIYVMNADGSDVVQLTATPEGDSGPRWSPDGQRIVFDSDRDDPACVRPSPTGVQCVDKIYVMNTDGSDQRRLIDPAVHDGDQAFPKWSPDGRHIVFHGDGLDPGPAATQLFIVGADGSGLRQVTSTNANNTQPDWGYGRVTASE